MTNLSHFPLSNTGTGTISPDARHDAMTESFWLREAKATLRTRDPIDAANDAVALADWADLRCGDILQTSAASCSFSAISLPSPHGHPPHAD